MKSKQKSIILKKLKTKEIEEIIGLKFEDRRILNNTDEYIKNAISTGSTEILEFTLAKIKEVTGNFCIKDEMFAKNILLGVLQTGNSELLQKCLDEVIDPQMDILNKEIKNNNSNIFKRIPKTFRYIEPLSVVLLNDFLDIEETEDLAIEIIEKGAYLGNMDKSSNMPRSLKFAIKGLYPNVVMKLIDYDVKLPDINQYANISREIDKAQGGRRKLRKRANLIKQYILDAQIDRYFTNVVDEEKLQDLYTNKEFKNILKDMLVSRIIRKKSIAVIREAMSNNKEQEEEYLRNLIDKDKLKEIDTSDKLDSLILDMLDKDMLKESQRELAEEILQEREQRRFIEKMLLLTAIKTRDIKLITEVLAQTKNPDIKLKVRGEDEVFLGLFNELKVSRFEEVTPLVLVLSQKDISKEDKEEIAMTLITKYNANIGFQDEEYARTVLNLSLKQGMIHVAEEIYKNTNTILDISNERFNTFVEQRKITPVSISVTEIRNKQLSMHLKERFTKEQIQQIYKDEKLKEFFTELAYKDFTNFLDNIDKVDMKEFGEYMLERALMSKNINNIEAVLKRGIDVNMPLNVSNDIDYDQVRENGSTQVTPLMFVITAETIEKSKKEEIVEFLLSKGADANKTYDIQGMSAIQYASCNILKNTVKEFIKCGVSLNSVDEIGITSVGYAKHCLTEEEKEKILMFALKKREQRMYDDIKKEIDRAIEDKEADVEEFVANLLDMRTKCKTNYNDVKLLGHLYSFAGKHKTKDSEINFEGWDGGGYPIIHRIDMLTRLAREIKYNNYSKHMMSKITSEDLMDIIKSEILNEFYVINGELNMKDTYILDGYNLKKHNQNIAKVYANKIKSLKKNETFSMHAGTKGHAIYMVFERMENGRIQAARYNLGQGSAFHKISNDNKIKPYRVELTKGEEGLELFIKNVLDWDKIDISTRPEQYKEELLEFFENLGGKRIDDGIPMKAQTVGNCSLKSDTAARVGRVLQRLKIQNKDNDQMNEDKLKDLAKNVCRFIKNYEREYARTITEEKDILNQQEINKKVEESVIRRYVEILGNFIHEKYQYEENGDSEEELNKVKREMINFLEKRSRVKLDETSKYKEEDLNENILMLIENLEDKVECINKIKKMSNIIYLNLKRDILANKEGIAKEDVVLEM